VGGIAIKQKLWELAVNNGGKPKLLIAHNATISQLDTTLGIGTTVMQFAFISATVTIGQGVLINTRANIHHDVTIGDFCEIGPSAVLLGKCVIGNNTFIGANATILPCITIGNNCVIGAGAVGTKNINDNQLIKGNPAK